MGLYEACTVSRGERNGGSSGGVKGRGSWVSQLDVRGQLFEISRVILVQAPLEKKYPAFPGYPRARGEVPPLSSPKMQPRIHKSSP